MSTMPFSIFSDDTRNLIGGNIDFDGFDIKRRAFAGFRLQNEGMPVPAANSYRAVRLIDFQQRC